MRLYLAGIALLVSAGPGPARAASPAASYALIVGSNRAGPGQKPLKYAHNDARQVRAVLTQLGGYGRDRARLLLDPDPASLLAALDELRGRVEERSRAGERSVVFFYYSGHARARALNMGRRELSLQELRRRLVELPATVTVAILDACQTGAISRVKGAEPTADFSYNSVNDLNAAGLAVMASSSGSELSQETDRLRGSYFTHNLVVGLRGAADDDGDGGVTLSEAYRYTYNRTLVATASTAVGKQHVTLETKLRGKGEMLLTRPARASAALRLPAGLSGQVLVHRAPGQSVVAELTKAPGKPLRLAFPPGGYAAIVRRPKARPLRCELRLSEDRETPLALERCAPAAPEEVGVKGQAAVDPRPERWALELGIGGLWGRHDHYNDTLDSFGFEEQVSLFKTGASYQISLAHSFTPRLALVLGWSFLDSGRYEREVHKGDQTRQQSFGWSAHAIGLYARWTVPLLRALLNPYMQAGGGLGWASTEYRDPLPASEVLDDQLDWGYHLAAAGGMHIMPSSRWHHLGVYVQGSYIYAPIIDNLVGDTHDSGGFAAYVGIRGAL